MIKQRKINKGRDNMVAASLIARRKNDRKQGLGFIDQRTTRISSSTYNNSQISKRANGLPVAQLMTTVNYTNEATGKTGNSSIGIIDHSRSPVNGASKLAALNAGPWLSPAPKGAVANHSHPYNLIQKNLLNFLANTQLTLAASFLRTTYTSLGLPAPFATHYHVIDSFINSPNKAIPRGDVNEAFDYYISRIADYSENLFYWPDQTKALPDEPLTDFGVGATPLPAGWAYKPAAAAADAAPGRPNPPIITEKNRLTAGIAVLNANGLK